MSKKDNADGYAASRSAETICDNMQWTKYNNPKGGHGFAAEDGNAVYERLFGHKVELVGIDNAKNGADLLIDDIPVQLKYCKNAYSTIKACFDSEGMFRYSGKYIMVPKDQYKEAVSRMREKITQGKVPGVKDPNAAESIIRKGNLTRNQAARLKRAGTRESLAFDILTQAQVAGFVGGISASIAFINAKRTGASYKDASIAAGKEFGKSGAKVLACGVATQQFLRSKLGCKIATKTVATKAIRGNIITGVMVFAVDSIPDTYKLCRRKMSWSDYSKSRVSGAAGIVGGSAGYMAGMAIGTAVLPGVGTAIGGFIGGILGGMGGSAGMEKIIGHF